MKKKLEFKTMTDKRGNDTLELFLETLDDAQIVNTLALIEKIEFNGLQIAIKMKWVKKLEKNLYEIRAKFGNNNQRVIYFQEVNKQYVITHGFSKKTQKTPIREINKAKRLRERYFKEIK